MRKGLAKVGAASIAIGVLGLRLMQAGSTGCSDSTRAGKEPTLPEDSATTNTAAAATDANAVTSAAASASPAAAGALPANPAPGEPGSDNAGNNPRFFPASKAAPLYYPQPSKPTPQVTGWGLQDRSPQTPQQGNASNKTQAQ